MKILLEDLEAKVAAALLAIRAGVQTARDAGLIAELPEKVDFQIEVITDYQALEEADESETQSDQTGTDVKPAQTSTTVRSGGGQTDRQESNQNTTSGNGAVIEDSYRY